MPIHTCPVCGATHEVHPILHGLAYGRQLTCSPRCKTDFPRFVLSRMGAEAAIKAVSVYSDKNEETAIC